MRKFRVGKFKIILWIWIFLLFSAVDFIVWKIKEWEIQNFFLSFLTLFFYKPCLTCLQVWNSIQSQKRFCPVCDWIEHFDLFHNQFYLAGLRQNLFLLFFVSFPLNFGHAPNISESGRQKAQKNFFSQSIAFVQEENIVISSKLLR